MEEKKYYEARKRELEGRKQPSKEHKQPIVQEDAESGKKIYREEQ